MLIEIFVVIYKIVKPWSGVRIPSEPSGRYVSISWLCTSVVEAWIYDDIL